jgi:hypothetical protein
MSEPARVISNWHKIARARVVNPGGALFGDAQLNRRL